MNGELLICEKHQANIKDIQCPFHWWEKHETIFFMVGFLI
jgi:hypothetical protein